MRIEVKPLCGRKLATRIPGKTQKCLTRVGGGADVSTQRSGGTRRPAAAGVALQGSRVRTSVLWVHLALTPGLSSLQMMMQYLYYGGTESMDIPTGDILEVRTWPVCPAPGGGAGRP